MSTVLNSTTNSSVRCVGYSSYYTYYLEIVQNSVSGNTVNITVNFNVCANSGAAGFYSTSNSGATFGINFTNSSTANVTASAQTPNAYNGNMTSFTGQKSVLSPQVSSQYEYGVYYTLGTWTGDVTGTDSTLGITATVKYGWGSSSSAYLPTQTTITCSTTIELVPTVYGYDGTTWRKAKAIYVYDGSQWQQVKEFYAYDGSQWRKAK